MRVESHYTLVMGHYLKRRLKKKEFVSTVRMANGLGRAWRRDWKDTEYQSSNRVIPSAFPAIVRIWRRESEFVHLIGSVSIHSYHHGLLRAY